MNEQICSIVISPTAEDLDRNFLINGNIFSRRSNRFWMSIILWWCLTQPTQGPCIEKSRIESHVALALARQIPWSSTLAGSCFFFRRVLFERNNGSTIFFVLTAPRTKSSRVVAAQLKYVVNDLLSSSGAASLPLSELSSWLIVWSFRFAGWDE